MLTEERQQKILQLLAQNNIVKLHELTDLLAASESTIRRDLQELENQKLLIRVHGGAKRIGQHIGFEADMQTKSKENVNAKQMIAKLAATQIKKDDVIYLDAGSSTLELIPLLPTGTPLKVVTNSVKHASQLIDLNIDTIILGGTIKLSTNATLGNTSLKQLQEFNFNKAFLGINGIDLNAGLTTPDPEEAILKKTALQQAEEGFILADHSKFNQISFAKVAALEAVTILTDYCPAEHAELYHDVKILEAQK